MQYPLSLPTALCALVLSLCIHCSESPAADLGIFDLRPGSRSEPPQSPPVAGADAPPAELTIEVTARAMDCSAGCVELTAAVSGGEPPYEYVWQDDGAGLRGLGPHRVCPKTAATYSLEAKDAAGAVSLYVYRTSAITAAPGCAAR